jgi:alkyl sulfatase BDS1-like metallo-beta-lactamase superfamily hydrolase
MRQKMKRLSLTGLMALQCVLLGCDSQIPRDPGADSDGHTAPTAATIAANAAVLGQLDFADRQDFEDASRGLIASDPALKVLASDGSEIWNQPAYDFIDGEAPGSVNPSLWRQAQLNNIHGLFEVSNGIYQLRGYDLSNMTIIEGRTGWIIVDPLTPGPSWR